MSVKERQAIELLLKLTRRLLERISLEEALQAVTDTALELLPAQHTSIRILSRQKGRLLCGARSGEGISHRPLTLRLGEGVIGWVLETGEVARVSDTASDPRFKQASDQGFLVASILAVPLWSAGRVVGVLGVTASCPGAFSEEDEMMATLLANCAAPSIERARLARLTITDHHTMAFNQRYLYPRLEEEIENSRSSGHPLNVLLLDLDDFKQVNDRCGHAVGDRVLQVFADRVRTSVRLTDTFIRRGGDEFVLIMPDVSPEQAAGIARRIRDLMSAGVIELDEDTAPLVQTVSIGVATWDGAESARELEARVDAAMYEAKRQGRDRVVVDPPGT